jgi:catechol 2,3-dioxygenase-like lactoylglutathione lyase family enzyme
MTSPRVEFLVNIDVADLERAIAFYEEELGLRLSRRLGPQAAELEGASSRGYLLVKRSGDAPFAGASIRCSRWWAFSGARSGSLLTLPGDERP